MPVIEGFGQPAETDHVQRRRDIYAKAIDGGLNKAQALQKVSEYNRSAQMNLPFKGEAKKAPVQAPKPVQAAAPVAQPGAQAVAQPEDPTAATRRAIYAGTLDDGYNQQQALRRVHEYNYALKQGLNPQRAAEYAWTQDFRSAEKKKLTDDEKRGLASEMWENVQKANEAMNRYVHHQTDEHPEPGQASLMARAGFGDPEKQKRFAQEWADNYAEGRARGWDDQKARQYADGDLVMGRTWMRFTDSLYDSLPETVKSGIERSERYLGRGEESGRENEFRNYKDTSSLDKKYGRTIGSIDLHIRHLIEGFANPQMAAIEAASFGTGALSRGGLATLGEATEATTTESRVQQVLNRGMKEMGRTAGRGLAAKGEGEEALKAVQNAEKAAKAIREARVPVSVQATTRNIQRLAHSGFAIQMSQGSAETFKAAAKKSKEGDTGEAIGYAIEGMVNGLMVAGSVSHLRAESALRGDLDVKAKEVYGEEHKFGKLSDQQQAVVINKLIEDDPTYKVAADAADKQKRRAAAKINYRYNAAVQQAWNASAVTRGIRMIHEERAETARTDAVKQVVSLLREQVEKRTEELRRQNETADKAIQARKDDAQNLREINRPIDALRRRQQVALSGSLLRDRQEVWEQRQGAHEARRDNYAGPTRDIQTSVGEDGHVSYQAEYWGESNHFGVGSDESRHAIYRDTPHGREWLDRNGNFTEQPDAVYYHSDPATADTVARMSAALYEADNLAGQEDATPEQHADAAKIRDTYMALVEGEITPAEAQKQAGIAPKAQLPDEFMAGMEGRINGPYHEKTPAEYAKEFEDGLRDAGSSDEEIQATLEALPDIAWAQVQRNLHHVSRPGDYIVSKRGVKWTLDAKGMLHPSDGGAAVPLMKRGLYSNPVVQIAASGRVGYGTKTRAERAADRVVRREVEAKIRDRQEEVDREMRLAYQNVGIEPASVTDQRADESDKAERRGKFLGRPPVAPEVQESRQKRRMAYRASKDATQVINGIASQYGISPDEVMRIALAGSMPGTVEAKVADLKVGDRISDAFRKDRPWVVDERKGKLHLVSGNAAPLELDRLNPSDRVRQIVGRGEITNDAHEWTDDQKETAAFEKAYKVHQKMLADGIRERMGGKIVDVAPRTPVEAEKQAVAAERRAQAAESIATQSTIAALDPQTDNVEAAVEAVAKAEEDVKLAEEGYAQQVEAEAKKTPEGDFPQKAPASIGYRGAAGTIVQNGREHPFHFELLPLEAVQTSHVWTNGRMEINPDYPSSLQPRTVSESESTNNALRGSLEKYDFRQYADKTINGSMGPVIVDQGGRGVGGNTRIAIMRQYLQNIDAIQDPNLRETTRSRFQAEMRKLAAESGIPGYPEDGRMYVVVRMMDEPITSTQQAAMLGRLFNKPVGVEISKSAKGISYSKSFDEPLLADIGRRVESYDGIVSAMQADPEFFRQIVKNRFGVTDEEDAAWFTEVGDEKFKQKVLSEDGRNQFIKALLGVVVKDTSVLNRIEGKTPYRALERALSYVLKMKALPDRDITGKILEALEASAETLRTDPSLHESRDVWRATYRPQQQELLGMETEAPPEPDRMVEAIWRAMHSSDAAVPRTFNDRLKAFIGEEKAKGGWIFGDHVETPAEAFNRAFSKELTQVGYARGDKREALTDDEFNAAVQDRVVNEESDYGEEGGRGESPEQAEGDAEAPPAATKTMVEDNKNTSLTPPPTVQDIRWEKYVEEKKPFMEPEPKNNIPVAPTQHPMTYLSGHHSEKLAKVAAERGDIGLLVTPLTRQYLKSAATYPVIAIDNGVFSKSTPFSGEMFRLLLDRVSDNPEAAAKVRFVVAPDVVGDAAATLAKFDSWANEIHQKGLPVALAAQDGLETMLDRVPWDKVDVLFIGGSTDWKLGKNATGDWYQMFREAEKRGIPVHVGRVNSGERIEIAEYGLNATTADGTFLAFGPDKNQPRVEEWLNRQNNRTDITGNKTEKVPQDDSVPWSSRPDVEDFDRERREAEKPNNLFGPPPSAKKPDVALAEAKAVQGYVTPDDIKAFLQKHPATKEHANEIYRTAQMMAEYVFESDPPAGVSKKDALDWVLRERMAKLESGDMKTKRGEYSDPLIEEGFGTGILKLHQAADPTTFIHEFAHVIFPLLSESDMRAIDTIGGMGKGVWDGKSRPSGDVYAKLSEKLAHGVERFLRDENPTGFTAEVKAVLAKIKDMMRKVYLAFKKDPLSDYKLTEDARSVFADMFKVADFDVADEWRQEVKKARAAEKKLVSPSEAVSGDKTARIAKEMGGVGAAQNMEGKISDQVGERVTPAKPSAVVVFDSQEEATAALMRMLDAGKIDGADLIEGTQGKWGVKFNVDKSTLNQELPERDISAEREWFRKMVDLKQQYHEDTLKPQREAQEKAIRELGPNANPEAVSGAMGVERKDYTVPDSNSEIRKFGSPLETIERDEKFKEWARKKGIKIPEFPKKGAQGTLFQDLPERHPGLQLEDLEARLKSLPSFKLMERKLLQLQIDNLKNRIRADHGVEERKPQSDPELAKKALQEAKSGTANTVRTGTHGLPPPPKFGEPRGIPKPPKLGMPNNASAGQRGGGAGRSAVARVPASLADVKPVGLLPLGKERGTPAGVVKDKPFDAKEWTDGLKRAGLPESIPAPTVSLARTTAEVLKYPGQKQVVQTALSALEQGDGVVVATPMGTGKSYTASAIIKEFQDQNPNARVLYITKNAKLKKKTATIADNSFGFKVDLETPKDVAQTGVWAVSYMGMMNDAIYKQMKWDLVVSDESGEARNWFKPENKQGKLLMEVNANARKAVYMSATPFHSPMEYGYLEKLGLWPKGGFDNWIQQNFAHENIDGKIVAKLDPAKQAKLRQQLIERGQLVSQAISYDGFTAHFGVVPVTDHMKRGLDRIREGFARARSEFLKMGKKGLAEKTAAFEATYTKAFLERERLPQAIELGRKAAEQGWQVAFFSEHSAEDLFRRPRSADEDPSTYQQLDDGMNGQLSKIIPPFPNAYDELRRAFGERIGDYSGRGNTQAEREKAINDFLKGELGMLYTSYAAGGIGVDMHDADFPELGVKGGDKPRVFIYLGPPYSGVLLEQSLGRGWRFGVKSDVRAVFLATDSEPDIKLMQTKVGPRMRALRAAVLGERDSLANVMSSYTDEEKVRTRQDALAYAEGDEMKVTATAFQVRSKKRDVGIDDWSQINFPSAETAKNKGMKYGEEIAGGDWSTLFQSKNDLNPPESPKDAKAKEVVDSIANGAANGMGLPPESEVQNLEPADRNTAVQAAAAVSSNEVSIPVDRDKDAVARQSMQAQMNMPGDKNKWVLTWPEGSKTGVWKYTGDPEDLTPVPGDAKAPLPRDLRTFYLGNMFSQEMGIKAIARQAKTPEAGDNIVRMNRSYQTDKDLNFSQFALMATDIMNTHKLDPTNPKVVNELWDVVEGRWSTGDPAIDKAAGDISSLMGLINDELAKAAVKVKTPTGEFVPFSELTRDANYMPHRIDWDAKVQDPRTGDVHTLKQVMGRTFAEDKRARIIQALAEQSGSSYNEVMDYLNNHKPGTPVLSHIHRARVMNFPIIKKDWATLMGYFDQAAEAIAIEKNFGKDRSKLNEEISKINSMNGRKTINSMFDAMLEPQDWQSAVSRFYNAMVGFEAASKMTLSAAKVPFHLVHAPLSLGGRVMPIAKALGHLVTHPKELMENATYVGTVARQLNVGDIIEESRDKSLAHTVFKRYMFNAFYKWGRAIAGESARVWMEQYAMNELKATGKRGEEVRRLLRDTMLIGDKSVEEAITNGRFSPEDLARAQTAFSNLTMFSDNSLQMPGLARRNTPVNADVVNNTLNRALRLTYALQSFSLKTTSILREKLYDEVVIHKNFKPLVYFLMAYPVVGEMLRGTGAGIRGGLQAGISKGQNLMHGTHNPVKHDAWDKYISDMQEIHKHPGLGVLKRYIDDITFAIAWDRMRRMADPLFELAEGEGKKARTGWQYQIEDELEQDIGAAWTTLVIKPMELMAREGMIASGQKASPEQKHEREVKTLIKFLADEFPVTKTDAEFQEWLKKKKESSGPAARYF